jgi:hypothetical protein
MIVSMLDLAASILLDALRNFLIKEDSRASAWQRRPIIENRSELEASEAWFGAQSSDLRTGLKHSTLVLSS